MAGYRPTMRRMGITHLVAIVLTATSAVTVPAAQRRAMAQEAEAIWRPHGVSIVVVTDGQTGSPATADARLVVTLVGTARPAAVPGERGSLGAITFDHDNVPATTLTIDASRVSATVAGARWTGRPFEQWPAAFRDAVVGRALGRVLAHELGHYLLASRAHTVEGLMRAAFDGLELSRPGRAAFSLAERDLPRLRARLAGLGRTPSLAENAR